MKFEWDEAKRRSNLTRHGFDFAELAPVFEDAPLTVSDDRYDYGEKRFYTLALFRGQVIAISHTQTPDGRHQINLSQESYKK
jgi:uncharacterized protein